MAISIREFLAKFQGVKKTGNHWMAKCPTHADDKPSLSIKEGTKGQAIILFCHARCETKSILEAVGLNIADLMTETTNGHHANGKAKPQIVAEYNYCNESGKLLYQAVRYEPKDFRQRRPDGAGGWIWDLKDVDRVLYRLPELIAADRCQWVFIVEGEKDVEMLRAWGLTATTNVGGAGKWRKEYNKYFKGRKVCIIPDNDPGPDEKNKEGFAGQKHAIKVYEELRDIAECVRILALPGLPIKGDVGDWKSAGGTKDDLLKLAEGLAKMPAMEFTQRVTSYAKIIALNKGEDPAVAFTARLIQRKINIDYGMIKDLPTLTSLAWEALLAANDPAQYFLRGDLPVRIKHKKEGVGILELSPDRMKHALARAAEWCDRGSQGKPPDSVVTDVLADLSTELPILDRLVEVPVFGTTGVLQTETGYHADSNTYYWPPRHFQCLHIPKEPMEYQVKDALKLIDEMLVDFPFASPSDKAHAIALLLLPFCRDLIKGPTPLHLVEASMPRSGKSLLTTTLLYIGLGDGISFITESRDDDEWEKKITTALVAEKGAILIDNINRRLDSGKLAAAITAKIWDGRLLGRNVAANVPIKCVWAATANNLKISEEMAGRTIRIRISPLTDSPERRTKFTHPKLREWAERERERLIQACHILIQNWIAQNKPLPKVAPLGMFESWTEVIGGILEAAGVEGFLENFEDFYSASNEDKMIWRAFCRAWYEKYEALEVTASSLLELAENIEGFPIRGERTKDRNVSLGIQLKKKDGAVYDGLRIVRDIVTGGERYWKLQVIEEAKGDE